MSESACTWCGADFVPDDGCVAGCCDWCGEVVGPQGHDAADCPGGAL